MPKKPLTPEQLSSSQRYALAHLWIGCKDTILSHEGLTQFDCMRRDIQPRTLQSLKRKNLITVSTKTFSNSKTIAWIIFKLVPEHANLAEACWNSIPSVSRPRRYEP